ncbi:MAG TPA: hypothetical protein VI730_11490, partial [Burkholderiales bacterium]|nr:hypothetical protein [Burkholderiales bacterium]
MNDLFRLADDLGPAKVIHVLEPAIGLKAVLVVDNVARGPSIGGLRMAPDVSSEECAPRSRDDVEEFGCRACARRRQIGADRGPAHAA